MPRFTAAAFWSGRSAGRRCRKGATRDQLPGMAASIAAIAPFEIAVQRQHEGTDPSRGGVALGEQRRQRLERAGLVAADREAEREPAPRFVRIGAIERGAVIGLGLGLLTQQIIGQTAIAGDRRGRCSELLSAGEIRHCGLRLAIGDRHCAHPRLRQWTARIDLVGTGEKAGRGLGVAKGERGFARPDQSAKVLGARSEGADVTGERRGGAFGLSVAIRDLGKRRLRRSHSRNASKHAKNPQSCRHPSPHDPPRWAENLAGTFLPRGFTVNRAGRGVSGPNRVGYSQKKGRPRPGAAP